MTSKIIDCRCEGMEYAKMKGFAILETHPNIDDEYVVLNLSDEYIKDRNEGDEIESESISIAYCPWCGRPVWKD